MKLNSFAPYARRGFIDCYLLFVARFIVHVPRQCMSLDDMKQILGFPFSIKTSNMNIVAMQHQFSLKVVAAAANITSSMVLKNFYIRVDALVRPL